MNPRLLHHVTGRLSLRPPQAESLAKLARALAAALDLLGHERDITSILSTLKAEFATLEDFEREFLSLCFALATGVVKTRLMGAFIAYLHLAHGINNFFVLAPNLTVYNKLITDFTRNTPKYVFKGIAEFAQQPPLIITGDNYDQTGAAVDDQPQGFAHDVRVNIFNISKINSEVRGGKEPRIKRMKEVLGDSYFNHLANLPDLVLLMDESHRYRASAGVRSINELKPLFGLGVTATPFVESSRGPVPFKNVVMDYPLARAMEDGFVKEPAVVTQRNFKASDHTPEEVEKTKLEDGVRLHETTKVELLTYARENGVEPVKPFMLFIARDTTHAGQLLALLESDAFYEGRYAGKVIQVDSSRTGAEEEAMITRLLAVESVHEPTEIVIHVNMLKEGWDVTNLYTIVPLRAANARTLIEQSIGRGLRLPYGKRTGVAAVDRLNIVAHDKFQEIIDEANRGDSPIRLKQVILDAPGAQDKKVSVQVGSGAAFRLGLTDATPALDPASAAANGGAVTPAPAPVFTTEAEKQAARRDRGHRQAGDAARSGADQRRAAHAGGAEGHSGGGGGAVEADAGQPAGGRGRWSTGDRSFLGGRQDHRDRGAADHRHPAHRRGAQGRGHDRLSLVHAGREPASPATGRARNRRPDAAHQRAVHAGGGDRPEGAAPGGLHRPRAGGLRRHRLLHPRRPALRPRGPDGAAPAELPLGSRGGQRAGPGSPPDRAGNPRPDDGALLRGGDRVPGAGQSRLHGTQTLQLHGHGGPSAAPLSRNGE